MDETFYHTPVMLGEALSFLRVTEGGTYFDGTLGGGGHSLAIMKAGGRVIATDLDADAIEYAGERFIREGMDGKFTLVRSNFKRFSEVTDELGIREIDGALLDLGVSSRQFDDGVRGFSYRYDAELDMRMDKSGELTAEDIVNDYPAGELVKLLYRYGEENCAKRIVSAIERERRTPRIKTDGRACFAHRAQRTVPQGRSSRENDLPGAQDRSQWRAGRAGKSGGRHSRKAQTGRQDMRHHLPLAGRQDNKERTQAPRHRLYLRQIRSGVRMRA